jgi:hypothetical protein
VSASVLCPGWVDTKIMESARNRPEELMPNALAQPVLTPRMEMIRAAVRQFVKNGFAPAEVAGLVFDAIKSDTFYVIPAQPNINESIATRLEDIRLRRNPTLSQLM